LKKRSAIVWDRNAVCGETAYDALPRIAAQFFAAGRAAAQPGATPPELHAFRLTAKRFRYTLEVFLPLYGPAFEKRLEQVRKIQSLLGDRQDCAVLIERFKLRAMSPGPLRETLRRLSEKGIAQEEKFRRYWRETFDAEGAALGWMRYFRTRPPRNRRTNAVE
jgi:CHAD domain-containing protein